MIVSGLLLSLTPNMSTTQADLTRAEIRKILRRHYGSQTEVARFAGVTVQHVNSWLKGKTVSANVANAAQTIARQLEERKPDAA